MIKRDLLSAAVKILGLCLLTLGILNAGRSAITAFESHREYRNFPEPWVSENVPAQLRAQIMYEGKPARDLQKFILLNQRTTALQGLGWCLVQALVGAGLIWKDLWVLRFLEGGEQR